MTNRAALAVVSLLAAVPFSTAHATWQTDGNPVCDAMSNQNTTVAISDGNGGVFVAWTDSRNGNQDIYMQRLNAGGNVLWAPNGVAVCNAAFDQTWASLLSDGAGGVIVAWSDERAGSVFDIYAQRMNSSGNAVWMTNGVAVCTATRSQQAPKMASNGAGGAFVVWDDDRAANGDVYAARVTSAGATPDSPGGFAVSAGSTGEGGPAIMPFGAGGALVAWGDGRNGGNVAPDIYAARISSGAVVLDPSGISICTAIDYQVSPTVISDGAGGAIIGWSDLRPESVYAQRINASGVVQWGASGAAVGVGPFPGVLSPPLMIPDGSGGAIISWWNYDGDYDIYAQRINASGVRQWLSGLADVYVCTDPNEQRSPVMTSDNAGGVIIAWQDARSGALGHDVYAQRMSPAGTAVWTPNGVPVCTADFEQEFLAIASDGAGGAITAWSDRRQFLETDIYAQRLGASGLVPTGVRDTPAAGFSVLPASPNPFTHETTLEVHLSKLSDVSVDVFDVAGRHVRRIAAANVPAGVKTVAFDGRDDAGTRLSSGVYFCRVRANGNTQTQRLVLVR